MWENHSLSFFTTRYLYGVRAYYHITEVNRPDHSHIVMCESLALCDYFTIPGMEALVPVQLYLRIASFPHLPHIFFLALQFAFNIKQGSGRAVKMLWHRLTNP